MTIRIKMRMGDKDSASYIEVWANSKVLPDAVKKLPPNLQPPQPGFSLDIFDNDLNGARLNIKAGTSGTIETQLIIGYYFWAGSEVGIPPLPLPPISGLPIPFEGSVYCGCVWEYSCTKQGDLNIGSNAPSNSGVEDGFEVRIESVQSQSKPKSGDPYVMIIPK